MRSTGIKVISCEVKLLVFPFIGDEQRIKASQLNILLALSKQGVGLPLKERSLWVGVDDSF